MDYKQKKKKRIKHEPSFGNRWKWAKDLDDQMDIYEEESIEGSEGLNINEEEQVPEENTPQSAPKDGRIDSEGEELQEEEAIEAQYINNKEEDIILEKNTIPEDREEPISETPDSPIQVSPDEIILPPNSDTYDNENNPDMTEDVKPPQPESYSLRNRKPSFSNLWSWTDEVETQDSAVYEEDLDEDEYEDSEDYSSREGEPDEEELDSAKSIDEKSYQETNDESEIILPDDEYSLVTSEGSEDAESTEAEKQKKKKEEPTTKTEWGYLFILVVLTTAFGSVTLSVYFILLKTRVTIPSILVNVSIISLLLFLIIVIFRYLALVILSLFQHGRNKSMAYECTPPYLKASILVPAYNEEVVIERSVTSLVELDYPNYEVIVIDDGSEDRTLELARNLEGFHGNVEVKVLTQENAGKSAALNHGAREATGDIVVCVDGDSRLHPDTLKMALRHFKDPEITGVAGNVKVVNRRNLLTNLQALEYIEGLNLVRRAQAFFRAVNIVPGPIGIFRREAILEVGGWADDTFAEDCDLTLKLLEKGHKIDYEPNAISYTEAPEELMPLLKQRYRWTRGILQAIRNHRYMLINPMGGSRIIVTMWQMILEGIMWPLMNIMANILFIVVGILFGMSPLIVLWWVQLSILDMIAAMYTVSIEKERLYLVPYAFLYRFFFVQIVDVAKLAATIEEMLGIQMGWGKLKRSGRI